MVEPYNKTEKQKKNSKWETRYMMQLATQPNMDTAHGPTNLMQDRKRLSFFPLIYKC
jgi:hypothetical protein